MKDLLKKILNVSQLQAADQYTITHEPVSSLDLMERASKSFVRAVESKLYSNQKIAVVCGTGNNGGDGFAIARILKGKGFQVEVFLVKFSDVLSTDCQFNASRFGSYVEITQKSELPDFKSYDVLIDALFGSGLSRPTAGLAAEAIYEMNTSGSFIFSVDLPSGLYADALSLHHEVIKATYCISFQRPKYSFFFPAHAPFLGTWSVVDIGLDETFIQSQFSNFYILDEEIEKIIQTRNRQSHKGTYGHALLMVGSYGKMGAAVLSSRACLRSGIGLLTTCIPSCGYAILQQSVPEAMCITDKHEQFLTQQPIIASYNSIGIGPGISTETETALVLEKLFQSIINQALVIDADALNILAENKELLTLLPAHTILTPHPKEFERLVGSWKDDEERKAKLLAFSTRYQCIVVLKDAYTLIASPEGELFFNVLGNAGMATGGSGDVLTGILTGLRGQGYSSLEAALLGVYVHAKAGNKAKAERGECALIAGDIIEHLTIDEPS